MPQKLVLSYPPVHTSPGLPSVPQTEDATKIGSVLSTPHATGGILFPELRSCVTEESRWPSVPP